VGARELAAMVCETSQNGTTASGELVFYTSPYGVATLVETLRLDKAADAFFAGDISAVGEITAFA
jgi:uroporphyrinogen-III synthase